MANLFFVCPQNLPFMNLSILTAESHHLRVRIAKKLRASFDIYFLTMNQFCLKRKRGTDISPDQEKWTQLRERLYITIPGHLAVAMIIKEMKSVLREVPASPAFPESDKENGEGYFHSLLEPIKCIPKQNLPARALPPVCECGAPPLAAGSILIRVWGSLIFVAYF